jgi:hypothetical protein
VSARRTSIGSTTAPIGEGSRQSGAPDAVDLDDVRGVEGSDVMGDHVVPAPPPVSARETDLDEVALREAVELMETRGRTMRRHGVPAVGEGGGDQPEVPRRLATGHHDHAGVGLDEPALALGRGDAGPVEVQFGSLDSGERTMLRGGELGNGAYSVVRHAGDHTQGV